MNDFRCKQCNRLLARVQGEAEVEIKCPRCKTMNLFSQNQLFITIDELKEDPCTEPGIAEG